MKNVVIVDAIRTPMGRSKNGVFRYTRADKLSAVLMSEMFNRQPNVKPEMVDDVIWGCVQQTEEQCMNVARNSALLAGLPVEVTATTVNRLCGSSMDALHMACNSIKAGSAEVVLVGGVEHMGHIPMTHGVDLNPENNKQIAQASAMMGLTAEMLGKMYDIPREEQDMLGARSHRLAQQASIEGRFDNEIVPISGHDEHGVPILVSYDEVIRPETTEESLAQLRPVFDPVSGTVTAGTSSALSDGASCLLVMSEEKATELGVTPRARIVATTTAGVAPAIMGFGPVPASKKALEQAGLSINNIDYAEVNEAFAAQSIPCLKELGLWESRDEKVNLHGGAISLGHPLGCSGARIVGTLINVMEQRKGRYGLATMCIGMGQGIATIIEIV
ncbi:acetyl-CoA C-acyltransferase FadA [Vibrio sp. VB16]|uniref:acetyl-CoA C-acyltransferase FadA n=1 Tax=Vibrio sp. VB16 TaxID=2785746 RepID=UPI00189E15B8|nr:acetyl-CoA C-acyltransferase FadA [Vibrio sp. VB16]UGA53665.1 acetyl-CoA C-acyltransferase FadA [Vibrio sp. VB16]